MISQRAPKGKSSRRINLRSRVAWDNPSSCDSPVPAAGPDCKSRISSCPGCTCRWRSSRAFSAAPPALQRVARPRYKQIPRRRGARRIINNANRRSFHTATCGKLFPVIFGELATAWLKPRDAKQQFILSLKFGVNEVSRINPISLTWPNLFIFFFFSCTCKQLYFYFFIFYTSNGGGKLIVLRSIRVYQMFSIKIEFESRYVAVTTV